MRKINATSYMATLRFSSLLSLKGPMVVDKKMHVTTEEGDGSGSSSGTVTYSHGFTKEQCDQLIQMLQSVQPNTHVAPGSEINVTANFAGISAAMHAFTSCFSSIIFNTWIIDSGASQNMTFDKTLLHDIKELTIPVFLTYQIPIE